MWNENVFHCPSAKSESCPTPLFDEGWGKVDLLLEGHFGIFRTKEESSEFIHSFMKYGISFFALCPTPNS